LKLFALSPADRGEGTGSASALASVRGIWRRGRRDLGRILGLYDPLMVSRTGGTIGHHLQNLRMVSLLAMAGSSRQKAVHDWVAGTTVQARDLQIARLRNFTKVRGG